MKTEEKQNLSSYDFWDLDASKLIHIEHDLLSPSDNTVFFTPHKISHYMIRWIKQGAGNITVDHIDYEIKPDMIFLGHPDQIRWFNVSEKSSFESIFIAFRKEVFALMNIQEGVESLIHTISKIPLIELQGKSKEIAEDTFKLLLKVKDYETIHHSKIIASLLQLLLFTVADFNTKSQQKLPERKQTYLNLYRSFLAQLNENYKKYHFTSDYADLMYIPLKRLNRACKSVTGKTAGKIISDRLDFEAKRLLYYSSFTVKEISYELGFSDPTYFIKFFRLNNGISPNVFRQKISKFT